jgi:hypothetical protein
MDPYSALHSYRETLARRIVADVVRATSDHPLGWVMLHKVARPLKVDEASTEVRLEGMLGLYVWDYRGGGVA